MKRASTCERSFRSNYTISEEQIVSYVRNVKTTFWDDSKVCDFSVEAKFLFLYFVTSPQSNLTGCYEISTTVIQNATGLSKQKIDATLHELELNNVLRYDNSTHEVLILNYFKHNWGNSPKVIQSVKKCAEYIKNKAYRNYILYLACVQEKSKNDEEISYPYSIDTVAILNSYSSDSDTDTNTDKKESFDINSVVLDKSIDYFNQFWSAYPKKKGKGDAEKVWKSLKPPIDAVLSAIENQRKSADWIKDNGQYIPYPAKWLRGKCWEDEVQQGALFGHVHIDATDSSSYESFTNQINELNEYD